MQQDEEAKGMGAVKVWLRPGQRPMSRKGPAGSWLRPGLGPPAARASMLQGN
jgi:hypothetical protein